MTAWTEEEKDWLANEGRALTVQAAARHLKRTYSSVAGMRREMGLMRVYTPKFWTEERDAKLIEMYAENVSRRDICRALNISVSSLETRATLLGITRPKSRDPKPPRGQHCPTCFIGAEHMAGCPRPECRHYVEPMEMAPQTLGGVGSRMLVV